ncbi:SusD family protein [compost metagenome]
MLSEAYNETNQLDKAITELNKVRIRSKMPALNSGSSFLVVNSKAEMSKRIQHERAVELAGEGWRYFDLKRWNLLEDVSKGVIEKGVTGDNLVTRGYQPRHKLWPVPGQEIEMNAALLPQNQDW